MRPLLIQQLNLTILLVIFILPLSSSLSAFHAELNASKAIYLLNYPIPTFQSNTLSPDFNVKTGEGNLSNGITGEVGIVEKIIANKMDFLLCLQPGKYTYKFILDCTCILDPDNTLYEQNEYNTNNSVIWIE